MYNHHVQVALATERRNTLLAEAESSRLAEQARLSHQPAGTSTNRRSVLRWARRLVAVQPKPPTLVTDQPGSTA
jgi:hypothetical protein